MGIGVNLDDLTDEISRQLSEQGKKELLEGFRNPKKRIHLALCREPYSQYMISS